MQTINLREFYPEIYQEDYFIAVPEELAQELDADYLGLLRRAALARPWHKEALEGASLGALELELHVTAKLQRSYDAAR